MPSLCIYIIVASESLRQLCKLKSKTLLYKHGPDSQTASALLLLVIHICHKHVSLWATMCNSFITAFVREAKVLLFMTSQP